MLLAIDKDGFYLGFDVLSINTIEGTAQVIEADEHNWPVDSTLVKPKLTDSGWIEGATPEEIKHAHDNQGIVIEPAPSEAEEIHEKLDEILAILKKE